MSLSRLASQHSARAAGIVPAMAAAAQPDQDDRFDLLTKYIPTETITLYVAAMSAREAIETVFGIGARGLYVTGAVLTPIILLLASYGKQRATGSGAPFRPHPWPYVASLIAYLIWALSVPGLLGSDDAQILAAFGALLVSTFLALLDAVFAPRQVAVPIPPPV